MKPGWQSSEFWITLLGQVLAVLALTGAINVGDRAQLETALTNAVTAIFALSASAAVVIRYIRSRTELKQQSLHDGNRPPAVLPALLLALLLAAPAPAAPMTPTCLFPRLPRHDPAVAAALQQIAQNQQTIIALLQQQRSAPPPAAAMPQQPLIIVMPGPRQEIPLGGAPRQEIPLGGAPRQDIPLGGAPKQDIPLGPPPRQDVPLGPAPRQNIPLGDVKPPGEVKTQPAAQRFVPATFRSSR